jgi:hypothetical protein
VTMRAALTDPTLLADALPGDSWHSWRVLLIAAMGEALEPQERAIYAGLTGGREREPGEMVDTFLTVAGRRSGKSRAMAVACVYLACLCDWSDSLALGERGLALFLAPSEKQAKIVHRYASAIIDRVPLLAGLVTGRTVDTLSLSTGVDLEVQAASARTSRGGTAVVIVLDETAFLHTNEDSANSDTEIVTALKPSLGTTGGPLLITSSPRQMEGVVYRTHKRHFGPQGDARIVVVQADTKTLNPKFSQVVIDRAFEDDATSAAAEYGGEFRVAVSAYLPRAVIEKAVEVGVGGRVALPGIQYLSFVDVAGGSGSDSFAAAVGHKHIDQGREICILDAIFVVPPPFDPDAATLRCASFLAPWRVSEVVGDAYGGDWPLTAFARNGVRYSKSPLTKSELYLHVLPLFTAGRVKLLDNPRITDQFCNLRRKVGSGGKESVDHVRGSHDDLANSVAGLLWRLSPIYSSVTVGAVIVMRGDVDPAAGGDYSNMPPDCRPLLQVDQSGWRNLIAPPDGNGLFADCRRFDHPAGGSW